MNAPITKYSLAIVLGFFSLFSCVPIEEIAYLQTDKADDEQRYELTYDDYVVGYNDILYVTINTDETAYLTQSSDVVSAEASFYLSGYTVDRDGYIDLPVIGKVYVFGLNIEEIKGRITEQMSSYFKKFLVVVKPAGIRISILGEVNRPGTFIFYQNNITVFDLLARCGDLRTFGNRKRVRVLRHSDDVVKVNYIDLTSQEIFQSDFYYLQPEDVFYVEPLPIKTWGVGTTGFNSIQTIFSILTSVFLIVNVIQN